LVAAADERAGSCYAWEDFKVIDESVPQVRHRGRASSERVLIEAAIACFAEFGPNDVSVRAIAERAGVNHGLVHHYFGSKAGLVEAVVRDVQEYFAEALASGGGVSFMTTEDPRPLIAMRAMARIIVDGAMPAHQAEFPVMAAAATVVQNLGVQDAAQSRLLAAQVLAMLMGWSLFEPFLVAAIGRNLNEATELRSQLSASAVQMVAASINR